MNINNKLNIDLSSDNVKSKKRFISVITIIIVLLIVFSGIYIYNLRRDAEKKDCIKIGAILSLTGDNALQGTLGRNGLLMAIDELNTAGGLNGKQVEVIIEDSQTSAKGTINAFKKLQFASISAIIVTGDIEFQAINSISKGSSIPIMATCCTGMLDEGRNPLLFRYCISEEQEDIILANTIKERGIKKITLAYPNNLWGKEVEKYTNKHLEKLNIELVSKIVYDINSANVRLLVAKALQSNPEGICVRGFGQSFESVLRSISELGFTGLIFGDLTLKLPTTIKNAKESLKDGYIVSIDLDTDSKDPFIQNYVKKYIEKYNMQPCIWDALGYDSTVFLLKGIELSENNNTDISDALKSIQSLKLLLGENRFNESNDVTFQMSVWKMKDGDFTPLQKTHID
ncbi:ABC transporter substrate-binding protein [Akkermansia massiliensis]